MGIAHHGDAGAIGLLQLYLLPAKDRRLVLPPAAEHRQRRQTADLRRTAPRFKGQKHIRPHEQKQLVRRIRAAQSQQGVAGVAGALTAQLHVGHLRRNGQIPRAQAHHLQPVLSAGAAGGQRLMGRNGIRYQQKLIKPQLLRRCRSRRQVPPMDGVEGAAIYAYFHGHTLRRGALTSSIRRFVLSCCMR